MGAVLEILDLMRDVVGGQNLPARRIHFQNNTLNPVILLRPLQLRLKQFDYAETALVDRAPGDDPFNLDHGYFVVGVIVFGKDFLEFGAGGARAVMARASATEKIARV